MNVTVKRLESGYFYLRGSGYHDISQVPVYPCDEDTIRSCAMEQASEEFISEAIKLSKCESGKPPCTITPQTTD